MLQRVQGFEVLHGRQHLQRVLDAQAHVGVKRARAGAVRLVRVDAVAAVLLLNRVKALAQRLNQARRGVVLGLQVRAGDLLEVEDELEYIQ